MKETKIFQTESKQLLDLMINSIYSNKEIFLRELISNASDALDKYKFLALTDSAHYPSKDYHILLSVDKAKRTITIEDNGIGMSKEEIETNLGTIAKSGSKEFLEKYKEMKDNQDVGIIGQFGVGFYSAFMVAQSVEVISKPLGGEAHRFYSEGKESYDIEDAELDMDSGTRITLHLKENTEGESYDAYMEEYRIASLVKKYSDYIRYPIQQDVYETPEGNDDENKPLEKKEPVLVRKTLNSMVPLWKKSPREVTKEQLEEFYKNKFDDSEAPLLSLHLNVEGMLCYNALAFIPAHPPYNLYSENYEKGLALYSKSIFIQDKCKDLIPDYLKFVKGLVDSDDFPLNISREMLQTSPLMKKIAENIENKIVDKLKGMKKDDKENYEKFFKAYGDYIKFGIYSSYGFKKDLLADLLTFPHSASDEPIDLATYVENMQKKQEAIYYASGKSLAEIKMLPQLEKFKKKEIDVLFLDKEIDEFALMAMFNYKEKPFKNIASESADELSKEEKKEIEDLSATHRRFLDNVKEALKGRVDDVVFSAKLVDSPVCISTKDGMSLNMERVLEQQPNAQEEAPKATRVLEINPNHPLFQTIADSSDEEAQKYASLLYDEALLLEGFDISDKRAFVENLNALMMKK